MSGPGAWRTLEAAAICEFARVDTPLAAIQLLVDGLIEEAGALTPPVNVRLLGSFRDVRDVQEVELPRSGQLIPTNNGYVIHVRRSDSPERKRFTVAHEICHTWFNEAASRKSPRQSEWTGNFDSNDEEEYLCDAGAGRMLLNPAWLAPYAAAQGPSLAGLMNVATLAGASIEATALQVASCSIWSASFVFWEPGYRRFERTRMHQASMPGFDPGAVPPQPKLRVSRCYGPNGSPFLRLNRSAPPNGSINRAWVDQTTTSGIEVISITSSRTVQADCESTYMPYRDGDGSLRDRVVTCIRWWNQPVQGA